MPMNDSSRSNDHCDEDGDTSDSRLTAAYPGTPRWVKIAGIIAALVVVLVSLMHLTGVAPGGHAAPVEHGVQRP
jgi:hypothetical protein